MNLLTIAEVAEKTKTDHRTVRRWIAEKMIPAYDLSPHGAHRHWRVREDELMEALGSHTNGYRGAEPKNEEIKEFV